MDAAIERVETVVVRVLRGIASRVARLVGGSPSPAALSDDDLQTIRRDWRVAVTTEIVPAVSAVYAESAETLAKDFADAGRPVEVVSLEAPSTADFLDAATNRLAAVSDTLWDAARRELADGIRPGEGIEELAARLQEAGGFGLARARTIARTEVVAAANAASLAQALRLDDGSMLKTWEDANDSRVREAHALADGQSVPLREPFEVGGEWLMYPGQPIGSAGNVINERCTLAYDLADPGTLTAAAEVQTGAMVALRPSAADANRLAVEGGEPADQLHCTLAYLGEAADIPPEVQQTLIDRLTALVEDAIRPDYDLPMQVEGFAIDVFNPPGMVREDGKDRDACIVLGLSGGDLDPVHGMVTETVAEVFKEAGLILPDQHTPWIPHATLVYTDDVGRVSELVDRTGPVTFDAIRVALAGEITDIQLTPIEPAVAAAEPAAEPEPEHRAGVDLADSGIHIDSWADNTYSFTDPDGGGFWLNEDEANHLIDALNTARGGKPATTLDLGAGGLEVALGDGDTVNLVPQDEADGWTLTDGDAYDLSYWLAFWLQSNGYYQRHEEAITAARRPWDPGQHPRGPDGRFIRKGLIPPKSGDAAPKSRAVPRTEPPTRLPQRSGSPAAPTPAAPAPLGVPGTREELARLTVPQLRQMMRDRGLKPGRARKSELVDTLAAATEGDDGTSGGNDQELVEPAAEGAVAPGVPAGDPATDAPSEPSPAERAAAAKSDTRTAVEDLTIEPGGWVSLAALRDQLGDRYSREEVDAALFELRRDPDVRMVPETNQKTLTPAKRAAALNVGNQDKHLIGLVPVAEPTSDRQRRRAVLERELDEARTAGDTTRVQELLGELQRRDALRAGLAAPDRRSTRPEASPTFGSENPMADAHLADGDGADANLRDYWVRGEGAAKIRWGTDGDFDRCVRQLGKHVRDPQGLCAEYHHEAVGKWPGEKNNHTSLADEGVAVDVVEVQPDGPVVETTPMAFEPGEHWHAVANWEDISTGLRVFLPDALCWREPPFAFHWQWKSSAHGGMPETVHVGMTTRVERDALGRVHAWGTLDLEDEFGLRYARRLARGTERWVSIGLDESFKEYDIEYVYHQPDVVNLDDLDPDGLEVEEMRIGRGRIAELSGVSVPAQAEAVIEPSPQLLEEIMALTAAAGDAVDVAPAEDGAVTLTLAVDDQTHVATVTPEAAAELAAALRMPPADGEAVDIDGGALNLSRDGGDFYLDLGPEAAILAEGDLAALADAIDASLGVEAEPVEEVVEVVEPPAMATRPAVLQVGDRSLAARVVGTTVEVPGVEVVVASGATEVHTITIPNVPPAEWFAEPTDVTPEGALTITDAGRVFGYLAPAGVAHRSFRSRRVEVPMGNVDYSRWMGGEAIVAGGGRVVAGPITFECGHCDPSGPRDSGKRMEHYDNTCSVAAKAAIGENAHGVWIAGALEPGVTAEQVSRMLACRLSGDWAPHPEKQGMREFVAALLVPVPGFAMGRRAASTVRVQEGALVAAMVPVQLSVTEAAPNPGPDLQPALDRLARGIGRDRVSRLDALRNRVHPNN